MTSEQKPIVSAQVPQTPKKEAVTSQEVPTVPGPDMLQRAKPTVEPIAAEVLASGPPVGETTEPPESPVSVSLEL